MALSLKADNDCFGKSGSMASYEVFLMKFLLHPAYQYRIRFFISNRGCFIAVSKRMCLRFGTQALYGHGGFDKPRTNLSSMGSTVAT